MFKLPKVIFLFIALIPSLNHVALAESEYPSTREERRFEEMDSILGGEGLVFTPGKLKNNSTATTSMSINTHLWQASLDILSFMPLASADSNGGVIVTDWYSTEKNPNESFKIVVTIKGKLIAPENLDVKIYNRKFKNSNWINSQSSDSLKAEINDKILRRARELHIANKQQTNVKKKKKK